MASSAVAVVRKFFISKGIEDHFVGVVDAAFAGRSRNGGWACTKIHAARRAKTETPILRARTRLGFVLRRALAARARKCVRQGKAMQPRQSAAPEQKKTEPRGQERELAAPAWSADNCLR